MNYQKMLNVFDQLIRLPFGLFITNNAERVLQAGGSYKWCYRPVGGHSARSNEQWIDNIGLPQNRSPESWPKIGFNHRNFTRSLSALFN